jgi:GntR family transcriptional regulator/MocR family aminotransferase
VPVPVPIDGEGLVVDAIPPRARAVYTTPSHQSPSGVTMSMARRRALLAHADRHGVAVIEDDYDSEHRHTDRPLEPLHLLDHSGRVIYVGTFSKTIAPSLRLGFAALPTSLVAAARNLRMLLDRQPPAITQQALLRFITDGHLERHLRRARRVYRERHELVTAFLAQQAAAGRLQPLGPDHAGLHVAALLLGGAREADVHVAAAAADLTLGEFGACWLRRQPPPPEGIVIGFGAIATRDLPEALARLEAVLAAVGVGEGPVPRRARRRAQA